MKFQYLLNNYSTQIIKDINVNSCRNCIYYKPHIDILNSNFTSKLGRCKKFGYKDIVTNKIEYDYVDNSRNNELLCGKEGKYFVEEKNINIKILTHIILCNLPIILIVIPFYLG